jgi:hypothetical protein
MIKGMRCQVNVSKFWDGVVSACECVGIDS